MSGTVPEEKTIVECAGVFHLARFPQNKAGERKISLQPKKHLINSIQGSNGHTHTVLKSQKVCARITFYKGKRIYALAPDRAP